MTHCEICQQVCEDGYRYEEHVLCGTCYGEVVSYAGRVHARYLRLMERAGKTAEEASQTFARARQMASAIPFGQPILVGHHSEQRDRAFRKRIDNTYRRGYHLMVKAQRQQARAEAAESNRAVSSDDPAAILKLQEKLDGLEHLQTEMRESNKQVRKAMKLPPEGRAQALAEALGCSEAHAKQLLEPDYMGRCGFPDYAMKNNSAEIRRLRKRIEELRVKIAARAAAVETVTTEQVGEVEVERDLDENRLRLRFPGKPDEATRKVLKQWGFRWSPANGAWQRQLNNGAEFAAQQVLKQIEKGETR